ncbi:sigma 54-interacting transcriptional regulator [bacterium 210820-DFI.6.37]|nr:sigma 54-interacting transcriptional regulator [bacterium 210820-DFI.6.37]
MEKNISKRYSQDFYKLMAENLDDEIFVTDGEGVVLFVNQAAVKVIGQPVYDLIGRPVKELVDKGFFRPSATMEVLKQGKRVDIIQTLNNGKKVVCTGVPIFDDDRENIHMVISTTKDVTVLSEMFETIESQKEELSNLREMAFQNEGFISGENDSHGIKEKIMKVGPLDIPVLLQGETGVGKEVTAKAIHLLGHGKDKPFVKINCGIIPENLIESELFGYEAGAFTGAERSGKKGKIEMAEGGTLFLDEIGEMPLSLQVKLLDFLQDGTFTRVGGTKKLKVHTRVITATNRNLKEMSNKGEFRKDLYFRINVVPFEVPPLRERQEDIDALAKYFLTKCNNKYKGKKSMSSSAKTILHSYSWPGNVRELEHTIEHMYVMSDSDTITEEDFKRAISDENGGNSQMGPSVSCNGFMPLKEAKWEVEKQLVTKAYEQFGSTYKVADVLKIDQSTVVKLLKKHAGDAE